MNVASLEKCRELYELSGWSNGTNWQDPYNQNALLEWPRYDLGYLMRKLQGEDFGIRPDSVTPQWVAYHTNMEGKSSGFYADTPEDAAAKLAIELFKQGILTREEL